MYILYDHVSLKVWVKVHAPVHVCTCIIVFVGSCLPTKVFIGNLPAMGRGWVIIK